MNKHELAQLRDESYRAPSERRCATCGHSNYFKNSCLAVCIRGHFVKFAVDPAGVCDLWKPDVLAQKLQKDTER